MIDNFKHLNYFIGSCQKCNGQVKEQYISGWGIVSGSAQCVDCGRKAKISNNGNIIILMEPRRKRK